MTATIEPTTTTLPAYDPPTVYAEVPAELIEPQRRAERPDGAVLLDDVRHHISRFWVASSDAALDLVVTWIAGTHATDLNNRMVFETYPHLFFGSKTPASGKSTALKMAQLLSARGEMVSDPTAPALLALIDTERAALMLDEMDTLAGSGGFGRSTRTILLESYKKSGAIVRGNRGNASGVKRTLCYAPVAMAGMWQNWISNPQLEALRTRTIMIPCVARRSGQNVEPYRARLHERDFRALQAGLAKWGSRNADALEEAWPQAPEGMEDRDAELVEPLLAVADAAGGDWPERIRTAVKVLLRNEADEDEESEPTTPREMLLADLSLVFHEERLASREIVARLSALPGSPWRRYPSPQAAGKEIAHILAGADVKPRPVWLDGMTVRGYDRADLVAAGMPDTMTPDDARELDAEDLPF